MKNPFLSLNPDLLGFSTSILCALHCAALPFVVGFIPLVGVAFLLDPWMEGAVLLISFFMALASLFFTHSSFRQKRYILCLLLMGFFLIGLGHFFSFFFSEIWFSTVGALIVAGAHLLNWNFVRKRVRLFDQTEVQEKNK